MNIVDLEKPLKQLVEGLDSYNYRLRVAEKAISDLAKAWNELPDFIKEKLQEK